MSSDSHVFTAVPYEGFDSLLGGGGNRRSSSSSWRDKLSGCWGSFCERLPSCDGCCSNWNCDLDLSEERMEQIKWTLAILAVFVLGLTFGVTLVAISRGLSHHHKSHHNHNNNHKKHHPHHGYNSNSNTLDTITLPAFNKDASNAGDPISLASEPDRLINKKQPRTHKPKSSFWKKGSPPKLRRHDRPTRLRKGHVDLEEEKTEDANNQNLKQQQKQWEDFFSAEEEIFGEDDFFPLGFVGGEEEEFKETVDMEPTRSEPVLETELVEPTKAAASVQRKDEELEEAAGH